MGSFFKKIEEKAQERKRAREQEKRRLQKLAEEEAQRQRQDMEDYARWYRQGIDAFLEETKAEGFSLSGGFETCPFIDFDKPLLSHITKEGDVSIIDFPDVRGVALDQTSRRMMLYEVSGKKRAEYLSGAADPGRLVSYKLINYDSVIGAEYTPHYKYETKYDDSDAMAGAMAGGIIDGLFGGRAGAYMAFSSASKPVAVTNEIQTGITLVIKTREHGYERIVFCASHFKDGYSATFQMYCSPITNTVVRRACDGAFSKNPYYVKERVIGRTNGTKKDFWLGLGKYFEHYSIEGNGKKEAFSPTAHMGSLSWFFEKCAEEIDSAIFCNLMTINGALGATQAFFLPDDSDSAVDDSTVDSCSGNDEIDTNNSKIMTALATIERIRNDIKRYENEEELYSNGEDFYEEEPEPEEQEYQELKPSEFPTKRAYEVAWWLEWLQERDSDQLMDEYELLCTERCEFIRDNPDLLAAKYLTYRGDYLYAQAVKEHFPLPFEVEEEDERSETNLGDLIMDAMEFDTDLALEIWLWCIREFFPHRCYSVWPGDVVTCMDEHLFDCPDSFVQTLISRAAEEEWLCKALMTASEEYRYFVTHLISVALRNEDGQTAEKLFSAYISGDHAKDKDVYCMIEGIIDACSNWEEKETLELFRDRILPIAAEYPKNARVINGITKWTRQVNEHIEAVESSAEKYAYSGRYLWRTTCADGSEYNLDPLNYETEEEYNDVLRARKYDWRRMRASGAAAVGLDINAYETLEEYQAALDERVAQRRKERQEQQEAERRQREAEKHKPDPLAATDKTTYPFCGVMFLNSEGVYHYRIEDTSLSIGDLVIAPVGKENRHLIAEIVSIEQHTRKSAPFPVDKAKFVVGRYDSGKTDGSTE